ncbi:hypothetical protein [Clostridium aciditolerans]|uniref:Uncharacterized protein n=1 Tax=Clostridium aciditolerans TaxID=339861 RepID=A0A934I2C5_9CLOT|nr:hypothetical protein [Clostridium aciditolerans]MBI6874817.1 hypothetical protein [Clostridium aciditolerans]
MSRKKIISLILTVGIIGSISQFVITHNTSASSRKDIKVMAYKSSAKANENGFQIDKYANIESVAWLNDNEVLTLTKKSEFKNPDSTIPIRYCSIYNLSTKASKDFKNVDIDEFLGVSPDKKYVLYAEARTIPKIGGEEWKKALDSGDLLHKNVKLLNLSTGEITAVNTEKLNSDAEFIWVGNNKILANYFHKWAIIDTTGKVYADGSYKAGELDSAWISGTDDIKDLGNSVEGKFYYTQGENGKEGVKLRTVDINTKEISTIFSNQYSLHADKKGKTIIIDNFNNNGEKSSDGVYVNRTFGALVLNESGKTIQEIKLPKGRFGGAAFNFNYILSPDGSKAVYVESASQIGSNKNNNDSDSSIKVIDTQSGAIKEIVKLSSLKDKNAPDNYAIVKKPKQDGSIEERRVTVPPHFSNIRWDSTGTALSFTYGDSVFANTTSTAPINTYIVSFDN